MDEKWNTTVAATTSDGNYEGFDQQRSNTAAPGTSLSTPPNNTAGSNQSIEGQYTMVNVGSSSFASIVTGTGREASAVGHSSTYQCNMEQNQMSNQENQNSEADQNPLCFVCSIPVIDRTFECLKTSMNHSHAPLLVLLSDVLGYKLEETKLHSKVICKSCFHLLDIIDELQQTLTESKTDVRTKFLESIQRFKLKYPRTDKMLKPRCVRCIQMSQTSSKKRGRGRASRLRFDLVRGRGSRGRGRVETNTQLDENLDVDADDPEQVQEVPSSVTIMEIEPDINVDDDNEVTKNPSAQTATSSNHELVFDDDPEIFSPDEKLKVGVIVGEEGRKSFCCMYCQNSCEGSRALKTHVRVYHMPVLVYDSGQGGAETRYRMGIKLQNTTPNNFVISEKPFACLFCESSYKLQSSLQSHFRSHHSPHKPFQCTECKESFRMTIELSRHRLYRCPSQKHNIINNKKNKQPQVL